MLAFITTKLIAAEKQGPHGILLVITDKDILGEKFEEGKIYLDLSKKFYKGREIDRSEAKKLIISARDLHLTGEEAVAIGLEMGIVNAKKILRIQNIPHAEVAVSC